MSPDPIALLRQQIEEAMPVRIPITVSHRGANIQMIVELESAVEGNADGIWRWVDADT